MDAGETTVPPEAERVWKHGITLQEWSAAFRLVRERPDLSARTVLSAGQWATLGALLGVVAFGLWADPILCLTVLNGALIAFYLVLSAYKVYLIHVSLGRPQEMRFAPGDLASLADEDLPRYTVLVPLYREKESLPRLVRGLKSLDYPKDRLEVMLLLEEDDRETAEAVRTTVLPDFIRVITVPDLPPKTKPKACNVGLAKATGEYLVIYDAEDHPEPDQLKKAVLGFRRAPKEVVCLQARLNFYNRKQNLLTRLFTTEYSMWFDLFLPGLSDLGAPIPLGGTSNHFRTEKLRELMGWDPYNVTEDCDLGVRIAASGLRTMMLDTTTWEEACSNLYYWLKQRSRWTKGYIQTLLVALRHPVNLVRRLGVLGAMSFLLMVGGTPVNMLANPLYWLLTFGWFVFRVEALSVLFPFPIILWGLICLFAGNIVFVYACVVATYRRRYYELVKYAVLAPFYWFLMSLGGWKGFLQLITRPSYWEKTRHGLDLITPPARGEAVGGEASR